MSRARNIKPGFFKNDRLAECDPLARILFAGLWCEADRSGRMEDRPKRLKAECLPYDECDIDRLLGQLSERGFIVRYQVENERYIAIPGFETHQNPHQREPASTIPAPVLHRSCTGLAPDKHRAGPADSPSLIPDSRETPLAPAAPSEPDGFARFWAAYPKRRREKKAEALKVWQAHKLGAEADRIVAHVTAQSKTEDWLKDGGQFVPQPPAYLRGKRWLDSEPVAEAPVQTPAQRAIAEAERYARQMLDNKAWTQQRAAEHVESARRANQ